MNIKSIYKPAVLGLGLTVALVGGLGGIAGKAYADECDVPLTLYPSNGWNDGGTYGFNFYYYDTTNQSSSIPTPISQTAQCGPNNCPIYPTLFATIKVPIACANVNRILVGFKPSTYLTNSGKPGKSITVYTALTDCTQHPPGSFPPTNPLNLNASQSTNDDFDYNASAGACK